MKKISVFFMIIFFFVACQKDIEIPIVSSSSQIAVVCLFNPDSVFTVKVSITASFIDTLNTEFPVEDAQCFIYEDGKIFDSLNYIGNGFYHSEKKPHCGHLYRLVVKVPGYDSVWAESHLPYPIFISDIYQKDFVAANIDPNIDIPYSMLEIKFKDSVGTQDYYEMFISLAQATINEDSTLDISDGWLIVPITSNDFVIQQENILEYKPNSIPFKDSLFNGQNVTLTFLYLPYWITYYGNEMGYGTYLLNYRFRRISKAMYLYRRSLIKHLFNQTSELFLYTGNPVNFVGNIHNGVGIFAGYSEFSDTLVVNSY